MLLFGPLRSNEESCPYFDRVATLPSTAPSAITYKHFPAVVLFSSTITGSDKRIMLSDVHQRQLWGYGTMARKEEASSTVISVHGLSGSTTMNFEIKVCWDSTPVSSSSYSRLDGSQLLPRRNGEMSQKSRMCSVIFRSNSNFAIIFNSW